MPGAMAGMAKLFIPDWTALSDSNLWVDAVGQVFYSLSTSMAIMFAYGSFLDDKTNIVIDTINQRTGGQTKYINQRDEDFVISLLNNADYHREFVDALTNYIDLGRVKYMIYTNKIYRSIFREDADEYRRVLRLEAEENERNTMYSEVLDLVASYETGFANELKLASEQKGRQLTSAEADALFANFENMPLWVPLREKARQKMASRDLCFRDVLHDKLSGYITSLSSDDFERFLGDNSMPIDERIQGYVDALKRLKNRE